VIGAGDENGRQLPSEQRFEAIGVCYHDQFIVSMVHMEDLKLYFLSIYMPADCLLALNLVIYLCGNVKQSYNRLFCILCFRLNEVINQTIDILIDTASAVCLPVCLSFF